MKIRKGILKTVLIGSILFLMLATWYINKFLAPTSLKNFLIKNISRSIDRPISLEEVRFNIIRGLTLKGLTIYEPDGKTVFVKTKSISTTLLLIPLIKEKKIIVPSIYLNEPYINIVKMQNKTWNFATPPLLKTTTPREKTKQKGFTILVKKIRLDGGTLNFEDNTKDTAYSRQLINMAGEAAFSLKENAVNFKVASQLNAPLKTAVGLEGSYLLKQNLFILTAIIKNLSLAQPYDYFNKAAVPFELKNGTLDIRIALKLDKNKRLAASLDSIVKDADISSYGVNLKGNVGVNGSFSVIPGERTQFNYKINLEPEGSTLQGVYLLNELSDMHGKVEVTNDGIYSPGLEGYAFDTKIKLSGGLKDLILKKDPQLRLTAEADLDLTNYRNFLPGNLREKFKTMDFEGPAYVNIKLFNRFKDPSPLSIDGKVILKEASLKTSALSDKFEKISGELLFKNDAVYISRTSFDYGQQRYILDAKMTGLASPDVKIKLKSKDLSANARFKALKNYIHILRIDGRYMNSSFDFAGDITNLENPNMAMRGNLKLDLADLRKAFPAAYEPLTKCDLKGLCDLGVDLNGPCKEPIACAALVKGKSDKISLWNLKLDNVNLDLKMKDKRLIITELSAQPYGGTLISAIEMDMAQPNPPYTINLAMDNIDLSKLVLDTNLKNKKSSGKAMCKSNIRGYGKNLDAMRGEGLIFVKGGYLWEMPLLKGLADVLFMPNLSSIVFDEASVNFVIANKAISTSDLKLHSQSVGLLAEGTMFFDGRIDFLVNTSISENLVKERSEFERITSALLAEAGQLIGRVKIRGTLKQPEYKFIPFPIDQIVKDKFKKLFGGFF